jgi:hypothetical protein
MEARQIGEDYGRADPAIVHADRFESDALGRSSVDLGWKETERAYRVSKFI